MSVLSFRPAVMQIAAMGLRNVFSVLAIGVVGYAGCAGIGEEVGRTIDPGYDHYLKSSSFPQQRADTERQDSPARAQSVDEKTRDEMRRFDERIKAKTPHETDGE